MDDWEWEAEAAEQEIDRFEGWLQEKCGMRVREAQAHAFNASCLADYLISYEDKALEGIDEAALKWFLYSHYLRKVVAPDEVELLLPRSITLFYQYLQSWGKMEDVTWIQAVCADEARYLDRRQRYLELDLDDDQAWSAWINELRVEILPARIDAPLAEALRLRRDAVTLLEYLRDHKVRGTQSLGNLPLKAVREINARLIQPAELETRIGDKVYRIRSEEDVWPIYFLRVLAEVAELIQGGRARLFRLTPSGERFLAAGPAEQVWVLFDIWWYRVNWLIAYPFSGMGEALPPMFNILVLNHLQALPPGERVAFEPFADRLIERAGLRWHAEQQTYAQMSLRGAIQSMVINVLADFGAVEREYEDRPLGKSTIKELAAFRITPFGAGLLASLG